MLELVSPYTFYAQHLAAISSRTTKRDNLVRFWPGRGRESEYGKYPKNSNTKASDKMTYANSVDPDQTAPEGAV